MNHLASKNKGSAHIPVIIPKGTDVFVNELFGEDKDGRRCRAADLFKALVVIGDGRDLEPVERFAHYRMGLAAKNEDARNAAMALIPVLRDRAEQERTTGRLLRAAERSNEVTLLRPAQGTVTVQPELLLRPNSPPNG